MDLLHMLRNNSRKGSVVNLAPFLQVSSQNDLVNSINTASANRSLWGQGGASWESTAPPCTQEEPTDQQQVDAAIRSVGAELKGGNECRTRQ